MTARLARGALWNMAGRCVPLLVGLAATPALVRALGDSRWGLFTIALSLIGAFGMFDLGIGRALTRALAERIAAGAPAAALAATGLVALTGLGAVAGLAVAAGAGIWVRHGLALPPALRDEAVAAAYLLCASAPLVLLNAALWGVIAAHQAFRAGNLVTAPVAAAYYLAPLAVLQVWDSLVGVMLALVACRLALTLGYAVLCLRLMPALATARPAARALRPLLRIGGWMTVSNVAFPVVQSADRFVIAALLSPAEAGYFATPFDLVGRLSIVPVAVMQTAFPAIAGTYAADPPAAARLFRRSLLAVVALLLPACFVVAGFAAPLLAIWLGPAFAAHAAPVLRWLGVGALLAGADAAVATLIDAIGRPDVNARLSLAELAGCVPVVAALVGLFGIEGAAIAWAARTAIDLAVRLWLAARLFPPAAAAIRRVVPLLVALPLLLALPLALRGVPARAVLAAAASAVAAGGLWRWSLDAADRRALRWPRAALSAPP